MRPLKPSPFLLVLSLSLFAYPNVTYPRDDSNAESVGSLQASTETKSQVGKEKTTPGVAKQAVPGGIFTLRLPNGAKQVRYNDKEVFIYNNTALVGIPITTKVGPQNLSYQIAGKDVVHEFQVNDKQYSEQRITLANKAMVDPPAETLTRIRNEAIKQRRLYNSHTPQVASATTFIKPLEGITTSLFGHRRFFNDKPRNPHSGLDIAADAGTPIVAAGDATVVLAGNLYFNGNTLFLDHGQGLITMYCHMQELLVDEGDQVKVDQHIGLVGATGRATGPHLHWSVSLNGTRVDPEVFLDVFAQLNED